MHLNGGDTLWHWGNDEGERGIRGGRHSFIKRKGEDIGCDSLCLETTVHSSEQPGLIMLFNFQVPPLLDDLCQRLKRITHWTKTDHGEKVEAQALAAVHTSPGLTSFLAGNSQGPVQGWTCWKPNTIPGPARAKGAPHARYPTLLLHDESGNQHLAQIVWKTSQRMPSCGTVSLSKNFMTQLKPENSAAFVAHRHDCYTWQ